MEQKAHLPIYGVGPLYGAGVILSAVGGIVLSILGFLDSGAIHSTPVIWTLVLLGMCVTILGIAIWAPAALGKKGIDQYIKSNTLCTTGVYAIVRNPCYTGIVLFFTGALLAAHNLWLLILPPVYWLAMTVLMKCTEEKWLLATYGDAYREYCKKVNRCIPWFPKK